MLANPSAERRYSAAYHYAHRGDGDIFSMAVEDNLLALRKKERVGPKARGAIDLIARNSKVFQQLCESCDAMLDDACRCGPHPLLEVLCVVEDELEQRQGLVDALD